MAKAKKAQGRSVRFCIEIIPDEEQGGFMAHIPSIPAYGEGETEEEAIIDLKDALALYVEVRGIDDALSLVVMPSKIRFVTWKLDDKNYA